MTVSHDRNVPGAEGVNDAGGVGVRGVGGDGPGVEGSSGKHTGVYGHSETGRGVEGYANDNYGVYGQANRFPGVRGTSTGGGRGVEGWSTTNAGLWGHSDQGNGVEGFSDGGNGVGVFGSGRRGVVGHSDTYQGVFGWSRENAGVVGESEHMHAVFGISHGSNSAGVYGTNDRGGFAASFDGRVGVQGDLSVTGDVFLAGADVAEEFDVTGGASAAPGTVVVLDDHGGVAPCTLPYDTRVAGIVSGAGDRVPALVLDRAVPGPAVRSAIALTGKAWCDADAGTTPIRVGDLLTTSGVAGHAMRATDREAAFGAVLGKALTSLDSGRGQVLVLVGLG
ncbi:hypothetical protein ACFWOG_36065 [Kitasatospora sp. NPDC058406]|uniref:hypothetical protein n=1 Tax=Kitasatospora sp. NPDC058406 TaxID=3346483 RepID=UPI00365AEC0E